MSRLIVDMPVTARDAEVGASHGSLRIVPDEWFRSPLWTDEARSDFEARLGRARGYNRPQYLKIKAIALREAGLIGPARDLLVRVAEQPEVHGFEVACAQELLGDLAVLRDEPHEAERLYRWVLTEWPTLNGTSGTVEISLAELLIERNRDPERDEAQALLSSWMNRDGLKFDHTLFRWHLALIALAEQIGDRETIQRAAQTALILAGRGRQFPRHGDVGVVRTDLAALDRLERLAAGKPARRSRTRIPTIRRR